MAVGATYKGYRYPIEVIGHAVCVTVRPSSPSVLVSLTYGEGG